MSPLILVAVVVPALALRDARRRGDSYAQALGRALLTLAVLPIGAGLCLLLGRPSNGGGGVSGGCAPGPEYEVYARRVPWWFPT